jgi:hypothetical protein
MEPSGTRHFRQIDGDKHRQIFILAKEGILGPPPLFARPVGPLAANHLHVGLVREEGGCPSARLQMSAIREAARTRRPDRG